MCELHAHYETSLYYLSSASSDFDGLEKFIYDTSYMYKHRHILVLKSIFN